MKYLLTSSGISNGSIHKALVESLGKPIAESSALVIPTAWYAYPGLHASHLTKIPPGTHCWDTVQ